MPVVFTAMGNPRGGLLGKGGKREVGEGFGYVDQRSLNNNPIKKEDGLLKRERSAQYGLLKNKTWSSPEPSTNHIYLKKTDKSALEARINRAGRDESRFAAWKATRRGSCF